MPTIEAVRARGEAILTYMMAVREREAPHELVAWPELVVL